MNQSRNCNDLACCGLAIWRNKRLTLSSVQFNSWLIWFVFLHRSHFPFTLHTDLAIVKYMIIYIIYVYGMCMIYFYAEYVNCGLCAHPVRHARVAGAQGWRHGVLGEWAFGVWEERRLEGADVLQQRATGRGSSVLLCRMSLVSWRCAPFLFLFGTFERTLNAFFTYPSVFSLFCVTPYLWNYLWLI